VAGLVITSLLLGCVGGQVLVGMASIVDSLSFGTLDITTGDSTVLRTFTEIGIANNAQFAYSPARQAYTFIAYDLDTYDPILVTLDTNTGVTLANTTIPNPPYYFGFQYDDSLSRLFAQLWYANGSANLVSIDPQNVSLTLPTGFNYFEPGEWWVFVSSAYDAYSHTYYALYVSPNSEVLVGITTLNGLVTLNLTLSVNMNTSVNANSLQYNNNTNTFYVIGFNTYTQSYDLAVIDQTNGNLLYANVFNNTGFNGDVMGIGLDSTNNLLSLVYSNSTNNVLATVDLTSNKLQNSMQISPKSVSNMLAFSS
jgi:hypothetical protein